MQFELSKRLSQNQDLYICDGFPIPICHIKRYGKSKNELISKGAVGYCASKDLTYLWFKGHLVITQEGAPVAFDFAPASIDERDLVPELTIGLIGMLLADKGYIRPQLKEDLLAQNLDLQTPLRKNMKDERPKATVSLMMNIRRKIETVIGPFAERFQIQSIKAKDLWYLSVKIGRQILTHMVCFFLNQSQNPENPLATELRIQ